MLYALMWPRLSGRGNLIRAHLYLRGISRLRCGPVDLNRVSDGNFVISITGIVFRCGPV